MLSCRDKHELFRAVARSCDYACEYNSIGISEAVREIGPQWSAVVHFICVEAHGKRAAAIRWGLRSEEIESLFPPSSVTRRMPTYYSEDNIRDNIYEPMDTEGLRGIFLEGFRRCDQLSGQITTESVLLDAITERGGGGILQGHIVCGRTIEEILNARACAIKT